MLIQLVGLPGTGKTSVICTLAARFPEFFIPRPAPQRRISELFASRPLWTMSMVLRLGPFFGARLADGFGGLSGSDRLLPLAPLIDSLVDYRENAARCPGDRVWMLDEFTYQKALSAFGYSAKAPSAWWIERYLEATRTYRALPVFLKCPPEVARHRARQRPGGYPHRLQKMTEAERRRVLSVQQEIMQMLEDRSPDAIRVTAEGSEREVAEAVARGVQAMMDDAP
jgi:thymidylate kinase